METISPTIGRRRGGTIDGSGSAVDWTLPSTDGDYTITCSVEDEHGLPADDDASLTVTVSARTNGPDGQTLVAVPTGSFMMGSEDGFNNEKPVHEVTIDGFWIGQCEVTNDQYAAFLNESRPRGCERVA